MALDGDLLVKPVASYIDETLDAATDNVRRRASLHRLSWVDIVGTPEVVDGDLPFIYYRIATPADFLRLAGVLMASWHNRVTETVDEGSEAYAFLRNPHTTAGRWKPAAALVGGYIELYGSRRSGDTLRERRYVARRYLGAAPSGWDRQVLEAIVWHCAGIVLSIMGRSEAAAEAERRAEIMVNG